MHAGPMNAVAAAHWLSDEDPPSDRCVYRYTGVDGLLATVLRGELRMGLWTQLNDPRERKEWHAADLIGGGRGLHAAPPLTDYELLAEVDRILRRGARLACFTLDDKPTSGGAAGQLFHRGWARSAMWDRYAAQHRGACLVFDQASLFEKVRDWAEFNVRDGNITTQGCVKYKDAPIVIEIDGTYNSLNKLHSELNDISMKSHFITDLYMTKCCDWSAEREFRIVQVLWNIPDAELDEPIYIPIIDSLRAIVIGEAFCDVTTLKRAVSFAFPVNPPDLLRCIWLDGAPAIEPV